VLGLEHRDEDEEEEDNEQDPDQDHDVYADDGDEMDEFVGDDIRFSSQD